MKYLILLPEDGEEIFYEIKKIDNIVFGFAEELMNESDMNENGLKPLEMVTKITFSDGKTVVHGIFGSKMYFDK